MISYILGGMILLALSFVPVLVVKMSEKVYAPIADTDPCTEITGHDYRSLKPMPGEKSAWQCEYCDKLLVKAMPRLW